MDFGEFALEEVELQETLLFIFQSEFIMKTAFLITVLEL